MIRVLPVAARDAVLLVARIVLGVVLVAHGLQKLVGQGFGATAEGFAGMGIPLAPVSAAFVILVEVVGGLALVLGAATALAGVLVVLDMLGAFLFVHAGGGVFVSDGGWELVAVIAAGAALLAAVGAGRFSVDHLAGARSAGRTRAGSRA